MQDRAKPRPATRIDLDYFQRTAPGVIETIQVIHREELFREPLPKEIVDHLTWHYAEAEGGWFAEQMRASVKRLDEWKEKHPLQPEPPPVPPPSLRLGKVTALGSRAVRDDLGPFLAVGISRFYWLWAFKHDRDRVLRELERDAELGYTYARVFAQVGSPDPLDYWAERLVDANWPDHSELVAGLTEAAYDVGMRILWTLIGKGGEMNRQDARRSFVRRMSDVLGDVKEGVLLQEVMNEPMVMGEIGLDDLLELHSIAKVNGILTATGACWTDRDATGFSPEALDLTQRDVGIVHLDRARPSHETDRPWRQGWDIGLESMRWVDNEPIGPGASVATEDRAEVLRSHRAVAFICRAFGTCFHADAGIRGSGEMEDVPGYKECPAATRFLPGDLVNGQQQNANERYPTRHWDLDEAYLRGVSGKGVIRAYGVQLGGEQYTIPFGVVSEFRLRARYAMKVSCYQQDLGEMLWEREVGEGQEVEFAAGHPDYLVKSKLL